MPLRHCSLQAVCAGTCCRHEAAAGCFHQASDRVSARFLHCFHAGSVPEADVFFHGFCLQCGQIFKFSYKNRHNSDAHHSSQTPFPQSMTIALIPASPISGPTLLMEEETTKATDSNSDVPSMLFDETEVRF
jgi:hypothetical protein